MIHTVAHTLSMYLVKNEAIDPEDQEIAHYGLILLLADLIQISVLLVLSVCLKILLPAALFCIFFCTLKKFIGGWHAANHLTCLGVFTVTAAAASYLGPHLGTAASLLCVFASLFLVILYAPIPHPNNPKTPEQLKGFRRKSLVSAVLHVIGITFLCLTPCYSGCAALGSLFAASTLVLGRRYRDEKGPGEESARRHGLQSF